MKVILLQDIKGTGNKGDIINTSDGHARNYLIPRKMGLEATEANIKELKFKKANLAKKQQEKVDEAKKFAEELSEIKIEIMAKSGESNKLFGSITSKDLSDFLMEKHNIEIDKKKIILKNPIKELGEYDVEIKVFPNVKAMLKVTITSD